MTLSKQLSIFLVLVLFIGTACSDLFNRDNDGLELTLQTTEASGETTTFDGDTLVFKPIQKGDEPREYPPFTSQVNNQQVIINGYYLASSGFTAEATFDQNNKTIIINVHAAEDDMVAPSISIGYFYDAFISNLSEGEYTVKIVHRNDLMRGSTGEEHTIFIQEFVIE